MSEKQKEFIVFHAKRDSVCMADDVMAPHLEKIKIESDKKISDLMRIISDYVPGMKKTAWIIICDSQVIGKLIPIGDFKYTIELEVQDELVSQLKERNIFCAKQYRYHERQ